MTMSRTEYFRKRYAASVGKTLEEMAEMKAKREENRKLKPKRNRWAEMKEQAPEKFQAYQDAREQKKQSDEWKERERARDRERKKRLTPEQKARKAAYNSAFQKRPDQVEKKRLYMKAYYAPSPEEISMRDDREKARQERIAEQARMTAERKARAAERKADGRSQYQKMTPEQRAAVNRRMSEYHKNNPRFAEWRQRQIDDVTSQYAAKQIQTATGLRRSQMPDELVELERLRLKNFRLINGGKKKRTKQHEPNNQDHGN